MQSAPFYKSLKAAHIRFLCLIDTVTAYHDQR